jgi:hypothetical protein
MSIASRKPTVLRQKKRKRDSFDDEGTAELSCSKLVIVCAIALTQQPLISESEAMDATPNRKARAMEATVDRLGRIVFQLVSDQCDFEMY